MKLKTLLLCIFPLTSHLCFAEATEHSPVVETVYYNQVDPKFHDSLYLFQLFLSRECINYKTDYETCHKYLKSKNESTTRAWYRENDPVKKQYLFIKEDILLNTRIILHDIHFGSGKMISPIIEDTKSIIDKELKERVEKVISSELNENGGKTGVDFSGSYQELAKKYMQSIDKFRTKKNMDYAYNLQNVLTKKEKIYYQKLLFTVKYLEKKLFRSPTEQALENYIKSIIKDIAQCETCTTNLIIEKSINGRLVYQDITIMDIILFGFSTLTSGTERIEVTYPYEYTIKNENDFSVTDFIHALRLFVMQNEAKFFVPLDKLQSATKPNNIDTKSWRLMKQSISNKNELNQTIWEVGAIPNLRDLYNSIIDVTTGQTQVTFLKESSKAMSRAVTTNFKLANIGNTINIASAVGLTVKHLPKLIFGESFRYLCYGDEFEGSGFTKGISLEELCIYVPNFRSSTFPISISSQLNDSDNKAYRIILVHDSGAIIHNTTVSIKQELTLKRSALFDEDITHYTLKIFNQDNKVIEFQLNEAMFKRSYGGVVKGNAFYFVKEIFDNHKPEFVNGMRASKVCGLQRIGSGIKDSDFFYSCLEDKYYPYAIPAYYLDNMHVVDYYDIN
ncbi:hypothetical protein BS333_16490 [Vibrio azureus]|uniref:Uncharacterized protein n=2 Tax=Vibrio azureus TaxID=512649 RepID=U3C3Q7_9VIBR|nr:hypothetical protein [Vibrio azureus]AUI87981.1 hypothetical protein BS333_16490 [Vibrio azureus]GAD76079.1 hypothetical protein VAZ01S_036_00230 [Vibrio azureus NBRC 104587]